MKPHVFTWLTLITVMVLLSSALTGCQTVEPASEQTVGNQPPTGKLKVVATTNIVGDVVQQVGGDLIDLTVLMSVGQDPHTYVPTPGDVAAVHDAQVVFANGVGLEEFLVEMLTNAGGEARIVYVSDGINLRMTAVAEEGHDHEEEDDEHGHDAEGADPHVWLDAINVKHWASLIAATFSELDAGNSDAYMKNAETYISQLEELDRWITAQVETIPPERQRLVTNHPAFGYFADRYGLEQVGAVYPLSPSAEPSARNIAALQDAVREFGVPAIFTESTVNPRLAEQIAQDTGVRLISLYTGSLGGPGSGAESYLALMRFNVNAIVSGLAE